MRRHVKRLAERLLVPIGTASLRRARRASGRLVLAYHNVVPNANSPVGDASLHLSLRRFAEQLDVLQRETVVVPLAQFLSPGIDHDREPDRLEVAITFDDAYVGAVELAAAELGRRGLPATIFVAPGLLQGASFWWDRLAAPRGGGLAPAVRKHALAELQGKASAVLAWAAEAGIPCHDMPGVATGASEVALRSALAGHPGLTLGAHSLRHPNLTALAGEELTAELAEPLVWLRTRFGERVLPAVAYPYGLWSPEVEVAARAAGYAAGFAVSGGRIRPGHAGFTFPRLNVAAGLTRDGFLLRLAGLVSA